MIDALTDRKTKEIIDRDYSKKENNDPKVKKKGRFAHLAERQEEWNDEFEPADDQMPKPSLPTSISDPEPPRKRFEVKTATQQVQEILARQRQIDAKE